MLHGIRFLCRLLFGKVYLNVKSQGFLVYLYFFSQEGICFQLKNIKFSIALYSSQLRSQQYGFNFDPKIKYFVHYRQNA